MLMQGAAGVGRSLDLALIKEVVRANDKRRFALLEDGKRIRAVQGNSTATVALSHVEAPLPTVLYHGTAARFLKSIQQQGLIPGERNHVHLSEDEATAREVGSGYESPVVLVVQATKMRLRGHRFFQADNGGWLTDSVPAEFPNSQALRYKLAGIAFITHLFQPRRRDDHLRLCLATRGNPALHPSPPIPLRRTRGCIKP
jgi:putative RNA 2'-phosphotransferase